MKFAEVAENVKQLVENTLPKDEFIYALLLAYGTPKATIARLKAGQLNLSAGLNDVLLKKKVWFRPVDGDLFAAIEEMKTAKAAKTNDPRFLIVTDFGQILAVDRKTGDTLDTDFQGLETHFTFFLPWAGMEKTKLSNENPADVKAAEKMAKLFDAIKQDNPDYLRHDAHAMNVFLARLLFCLFAEDTGIFTENAVSNAIASHTAEDGTDLDAFFKQLFDLLDTPDKKRGNLPDYLKCFPYVNGGLFRDHYDIPQFSAKSRRMLIEAGSLTWAEINPDIFGSMFQTVIDPEKRHNLGQHYTSVTNIMKVIEPLFLNDFKEEFEKACERKTGKTQALHRLLDRIANVKIFDPACGSGNFLIIAYKELRRLEIEVFQELDKIERQMTLSGMTVNQFYGIEIDDFACETATLSLWLAEHQMNMESRKKLGRAPVSLPLKDGAKIVCDNACRRDWETVCPKNNGDEIYILGNPPYLGFNLQNEGQRADMKFVFAPRQDYKRLDYIACWFQKGADYLRGINARLAFVSTNSICQGEQVNLLWPSIFSKGLEIGFAHQPFKWSNNAKGSAGVTCVIVGLRNKAEGVRYLYTAELRKAVDNINAYLTAGSEVIVAKRGTPISKIPSMLRGDMPIDGGHLILAKAERDSLIEEYPEAQPLVREFVGADEFLKGNVRWCLWISNDALGLAEGIPPIKSRLQKVRQMRLESDNASTRDLAQTPHLFGQIRHVESPSIIIPSTTSERRDYVPIGFTESQTIISNLAYSIPCQAPFLFGILSSRIHTTWVRAVAGGLETRIRYTSGLCYNTFPIPDLTKEQKQTITMHVGNVLEEREKHPEKTMAQLYDPDKMPAGLREAHHQLDLAVDRIYRSKPFASDEERLEHLFKLYEEMTAKETLI